MAVAIQRMVGSKRGTRYYPELAGVGRSYNFYPIPPQETGDGIVSMALGLGKMVVEGGPSVKFSPRHPGIPRTPYLSRPPPARGHEHSLSATRGEHFLLPVQQPLSTQRSQQTRYEWQ